VKSAVDRSPTRAPARFGSHDRPGQWIWVDRKTLVVTATGSIQQSIAGAPRSVHPRGWAIERSADGANWVELDSGAGTAELNRLNAVAIFAIKARVGVRFARRR
jgi:hypothetical protein